MLAILGITHENFFENMLRLMCFGVYLKNNGYLHIE